MSRAEHMTATLSGATSPDDLTRPLFGANIGQALVRFIKRSFHFHGRSSRSEFWYVALLFFGVSLIFSSLASPWYSQLVDALMTGDVAQIAAATALVPSWYSVAQAAWWILTIIPSLAIIWRRLHDSNLAGPWFFLILVPILGAFVLLVFFIRKSRPEGRRYDRR